MKTFAQKPKAAQQTNAVKSALPVRAHIGHNHEVNSILRLQRTIGNQAVQLLLQRHADERNTVLTGTTSPGFGHDFGRIPVSAGPIHTKLAINKPGDEYEQEADRVADRVMRMSKPKFQRVSSPPEVSRKCASCEEEEKKELQTKRLCGRGSALGEAPPIVHEVLRQPSRPLDAGTRTFMEQRFGHDFSDVQIHDDFGAGQASLAVQARAFTVGSHVMFAPGEYRPETETARRLIAHELTHVVQQTNSQRTIVQRQPVDCDPNRRQGYPLIYDRWGAPPRPSIEDVGDAQIKLNRFLRRFAAEQASAPTIRAQQKMDSNYALLKANPPKNPKEAGDMLDVDCKFGRSTMYATLIFQAARFPYSTETTAATPSDSKWDGKIGERTWIRLDAEAGGSIVPPITIPPFSRPCYSVMGAREVDYWLNYPFGKMHTYINFYNGAAAERWLVEAGPDETNTVTAAGIKKNAWETRGHERARMEYSQPPCAALPACIESVVRSYDRKVPYRWDGPNSNSFIEQLTYKCGLAHAFMPFFDEAWDYWRKHTRPF